MLWYSGINAFRVVSEITVASTNQAFADTATEMGKTVDELAQEIYNIALWIEENGNKGYSTDAINKVFGAGATRLMKLDACTGVFFYAEGKRKWELKGWGLRRNPPWLTRLCEVVGYDSAFAKERVAEWYAQALLDNQEFEQARSADRKNHRLRNVNDLSDREVITLLLGIVDRTHPDASIVQPSRAHVIVSQLRKLLKNAKGDF